MNTSRSGYIKTSKKNLNHFMTVVRILLNRCRQILVFKIFFIILINILLINIILGITRTKNLTSLRQRKMCEKKDIQWPLKFSNQNFENELFA